VHCKIHYYNPQVQCMWPIFVSKIDRNVTREIDFMNLKTASGTYIAKLKPQWLVWKWPKLREWLCNSALIWKYKFKPSSGVDPGIPFRVGTYCLLISNFSYATNIIHKSQMTKPTLVYTSLHYTVTKKKKGIHKATDQSDSHKIKIKNWPIQGPLHMVHSDHSPTPRHHWERQKMLTSTAHQSSNKTKYSNKAKISVKWESQLVRERERASKIPILRLSSISAII
jgi:hypothetical protein